MIDGLVGVFVMVGVTTFMAALVELGSFVLLLPPVWRLPSNSSSKPLNYRPQ